MLLRLASDLTINVEENVEDSALRGRFLLRFLRLKKVLFRCEGWDGDCLLLRLSLD